MLRVTQSRQPCYKLNHRFGHPLMSRRSQESFRTGWFYSIVEPGFVKPGDTIALLERTRPEWPVSRVQHFLYREPNNMEAARELATLEPLAPKLREIFAKRAESARVEEWEDRLWNRPPVDTEEPDWFDTRVEQASYAVPGVKCFRLTRADGKKLPEFDAGAHIDLRLPNGLLRHYSLCNVRVGWMLRDRGSFGDERRRRVAVSARTGGSGLDRSRFRGRETHSRPCSAPSGT